MFWNNFHSKYDHVVKNIFIAKKKNICKKKEKKEKKRNDEFKEIK